VGLSSELEQMVASPVTDANHLHLLVVTHHLGLGGGQLWLSELLERCGAGVEFSCTVVAPRDGALRRVLEKRGINVHLLGEIPISNTREYGDRLAEFAIWVTARRFNAVLVNTFGAWFGADVARRLGLPCVWAIHESWPPEQFWSAAYPPDYVPAGVRESCMQALWNTKAVVFEAEATRRLFLHDTPPGAARVVPYGVNTREIDEYCATVSRARARELTNLPEDARVILVLGTVEPRKAQAVAAEAFAAVASRYPTAILALVGGSDNQYTKTLESYIQRMGLDRQIQLFPVVNEVFPWYRSADYLLCASDVESLPRSILEVMAFGVPVVATNVFGIPELISDGQNGFLFAPRSLAATIAALERALVQDSNTLASVSGHARELIHSRYDSIHYATQVRTLLEELARERATNPGDLLR
jgi:glycosyltransferase involved in cell wall biosynthesis